MFARGCINRYNLTEEDRIIQFAAISFDASIEEIFPGLCCGATIIIRSEEAILSTGRFLDFCHATRPTVLDLPSSFWQRIISSSDISEIPSSINKVIIGDTRAMDEPVRKWLDSPWKHIDLYNTYGPTETTVVATSYLLTQDTIEFPLPIGKPVKGAEIILLNHLNQKGIPSKPNRLFIGGCIVAKGYLNDQNLTLNKFQHICSEGEKKSFYDSGDLVSVNEDGNLIYCGRTDDQLKVRGFRVEVQEIEQYMLSYPGLIDCVVMPKTDERGDIDLIAYSVLKPGYHATEIENKLRNDLPSYMIPSQIIEIESIPYTINNKPDLGALHRLNKVPDTITQLSLPESENEKKIFAIWQPHFRGQNFGIDSNFFHLGGNSLVALEIMSELETTTGRNIPLATLFTYPTIRQLAKAIELEFEKEMWRPLVMIRKGKKGYIPLFIIHGGGLNVLLFNTLVAHLSTDQTVYGIQAHGLDGKSKPHNNIDAISNHYLSEMHRVNPNGPFALAGFSIGGLIAYELACRLSENSEKVSFLGLFDTPAIEPHANRPILERKLDLLSETIKKVLYNLWLILRNPFDIIPKKVKLIRYRFRMRNLAAEALDREELMDLPKKLIHIAKANLEAVRSMSLRHYNGDLHLFRAKKRDFYLPDRKYLGWNTFVEEVVIHEIPGEHSRIFAPPNDRQFAEVLQKCLDNMDINKDKN